MEKKKGWKIYRKLFASTFYISAFTFGGGYVIVPLLKKKFVDDLKWIEEEEMLDLTAISQSSPGAMAVNASMLIGYRIAGITGALITILGTILPPLIILSVISLFYQAFQSSVIVNAVLRGMRGGVAAVIADVSIGMIGGVLKERKVSSTLIMIGAFIASYVLNINVIYIVLASALFGALGVVYQKKFRKEKPQE